MIASWLRYLPGFMIGLGTGVLLVLSAPPEMRPSETARHRQLVLQSCMDTGRSLFLCEAILAGKVHPSEKGL